MGQFFLEYFRPGKRLSKGYIIFLNLVLFGILLSLQIDRPFPALQSVSTGISIRYKIMGLIFALQLAPFIISPLVLRRDSPWYVVVSTSVTFLSLISLPLIMGFEFYGRGHDALKHLGYAKDIIFSGNITKGNIYPLSHIQSSIVTFITGFPLTDSVMILVPIYVTLMLLGLYLLGSRAQNASGSTAMLVCFTLVFTPFYGLTLFKPYFMVICFIPIIIFSLYQLLSNISKAHLRTLPILVACITLLHPLGGASLIVFLGAALAVEYVQPFRLRIPHFNKLFVLTGLITVLLGSWMMYQATDYFDLTLTRFVYLIARPGVFFSEMSLLSSKVDQAQEGASLGYNIINYIIQWYGPLLAGGGITIISTLYLVNSIVDRQDKPNVLPIILVIWVISEGVVAALHPLINIINASPTRLLPLPMVFSTAIFSIISHRSRLLRIIMILFVICALPIGLVNLHPGPENLHSTPQVLEEDFEGTSWVYQYKDRSFQIKDFRTHQSRFGFAVLGATATQKRTDINAYITGGGEQDPSIIDPELSAYQGKYQPLYNTTTYIPVSWYDRYYFKEVYERLPYNDVFGRLTGDHNANQVYANGDFNVYIYNQETL